MLGNELVSRLLQASKSDPQRVATREGFLKDQTQHTVGSKLLPVRAQFCTHFHKNLLSTHAALESY